VPRPRWPARPQARRAPRRRQKPHQNPHKANPQKSHRSPKKRPRLPPPQKKTPKKERGDYTFPEDVEVDLAVWLHQHPHLWDTTDEGYRDLDLIRQTWDEGADQFNCTGE